MQYRERRMLMKNHQRHGLALVLGVVGLAVIISMVIILILFSATMSAQTLTYTEENMQTDTALYVLLNNNELTPRTTLPFKNILAIAIEKNIKFLDTDITLEYNGETETVNMKDIVEENLENLGVEEYHFYVLWNYETILGVRTPDYSKNSTEEIEYISIPAHNSARRIATVVLKISKERQKKDTPACPTDINHKCYPKYTCKQYGGTCTDDKYACSLLECCCENARI